MDAVQACCYASNLSAVIGGDFQVTMMAVVGMAIAWMHCKICGELSANALVPDGDGNKAIA